MKVQIHSRQTLADLALQLYGSMEAVFLLASDNGLEITDTLTAGDELLFNPAHMQQKWIAHYFKTKKLRPGTFFPHETKDGIFDATFTHQFN